MNKQALIVTILVISIIGALIKFIGCNDIGLVIKWIVITFWILFFGFFIYMFIDEVFYKPK